MKIIYQVYENDEGDSVLIGTFSTKKKALKAIEIEKEKHGEAFDYEIKEREVL